MRLMSVFVLVMMVMLALVPGTYAQSDSTNSATFSEAFINAQIQANLPAGSNLTSLSVDLQPDQIVIAGTITGEQNPLDLALTLVPTVDDGRVSWEATALTIGGFDLDLTQFESNSNAAEAVGGLKGLVADAVQDRPVESLTVTDNTLTFTWERADPDGPAFNLVDARLSMTVTESYVNALPAVTDPANPALADLEVDFQSGQLVLTGKRTTLDDTTLPFSMTLVPTLYNGLVTWVVTGMITDSMPEIAQSIGQMNDDITGSWRMFFDGIYRRGNIADIAITDTDFTLTWDSSLEPSAPVFERGQSKLVISEATINATYRITNPSGYQITNGHADCQPGQVVITADLNLNSGQVLQQVTTFVPSVQNGVVVWTVTDATLDGTPLDQAIIDHYNEFVTGWWRGVLWGQMREYEVTSVTVSDDEIVVSALAQ